MRSTITSKQATCCGQPAGAKIAGIHAESGQSDGISWLDLSTRDDQGRWKWVMETKPASQTVTTRRKPARPCWLSSRKEIFPTNGSPRLKSAAEEDVGRIEISPFGLHWPMLDELNANLAKVIEMLLEDGEPVMESEFIGTQTVQVG